MKSLLDTGTLTTKVEQWIVRKDIEQEDSSRLSPLKKPKCQYNNFIDCKDETTLQDYGATNYGVSNCEVEECDERARQSVSTIMTKCITILVKSRILSKITLSSVLTLALNHGRPKISTNSKRDEHILFSQLIVYTNNSVLLDRQTLVYLKEF